VKVYVGSAVWRTVEAFHLSSLMPLLREPNVEYCPILGDALIERSRCISATHFLNSSDADVHLSIDSDITGFTVEDTLRMCEQTMTHDIVAGVYVTRNMDRTFPTSFFEQDVEVEMAFDPTPVPARWVATGFMATHRRVFEKLAEDMPLLHAKDGARSFYPFYIPFIVNNDEGDPILLSEDYAFCERASQAGFGININPAIRLGHVGQITFRVEDMFYKPIKPHPLTIKRHDGAQWTVKSMEPPSQESRQVKRAKERQEVKREAVTTARL
jgi:hypothetical protein